MSKSTTEPRSHGEDLVLVKLFDINLPVAEPIVFTWPVKEGLFQITRSPDHPITRSGEPS